MKKLLLIGFGLFFLVNSIKAQNSISGYIVSLETAEPIANATIFLNNRYGLPTEDSLRVTSDSTGFYRIARIEAGTYIINAWTTYQAMNEHYAQVIQSNRIEVDSSLNVDFVFSEIAFKYRLHGKYHPWEAFIPQKRSLNMVARRAVRLQLFINSQRKSLGASFIERMK